MISRIVPAYLPAIHRGGSVRAADPRAAREIHRLVESEETVRIPPSNRRRRSNRVIAPEWRCLPKVADRPARGVHWLDWPCGQNPGRKPEGHQRALAREAMSLGERSDLQGQLSV